MQWRRWCTAQWLRVVHGAVASCGARRSGFVWGTAQWLRVGHGAAKGAVGHGLPPSGDFHKSSEPDRPRTLSKRVSVAHGEMAEVVHGAVALSGTRRQQLRVIRWCTAQKKAPWARPGHPKRAVGQIEVGQHTAQWRKWYTAQRLGVGHGAVASCGTLRVARGAVAGVAHGAQNKRTSAVYCGSRRSGIGGTRRRGLAWGTAPWLGWYTAPYLGWHTPPKIKMTHVAYSWYTAQWLRVAHGAIATAEHGDGAKRGAIGHGRPPSDSHKSSGPGRSRTLP